MTKKNRVATIIAACIVIAAGVTGSVYAAVTVAYDKEEAESSTVVVTTEAETSTEATTEAVTAATTEVVTTTPATTTTTVTTLNPDAPYQVTQIPFKTQEELDKEYVEYLNWLKEEHELALRASKNSLGNPPDEFWSDGTPRDRGIYEKELAEYEINKQRYNEYVARENERYQQSLKEAKIKYNQP